MTEQRRQGISEILKIISGIKDPKQRQDALGTCASIKPLVQILMYMFHPDVVFNLPEGAPNFKKMPKAADSEGSLYRESRTLYLFIKGQADNIPDLKRQTMFVQLLEALDPDDAELVLAMKEKRCPYKNITYDLVHNTFPGLLPDLNQHNVTKTDDVLDLQSSQIVVSGKDEKKDRSKAKPCPFGCISSAEDGNFLPGPLAKHVKNSHQSEKVG